MASTPVLGSLETNPEDYTSTTTYRDTKDGRRLHYELTCLQQPERARACGSGQKCKLYLLLRGASQFRSGHG